MKYCPLLQLFSMIKSEDGIKRRGDFFWSVGDFSLEKDTFSQDNIMAVSFIGGGNRVFDLLQVTDKLLSHNVVWSTSCLIGIRTYMYFRRLKCKSLQTNPYNTDSFSSLVTSCFCNEFPMVGNHSNQSYV